MKRLFYFDDVLSMTNLVPRRTGLKCNVFIDDSGNSRHAKHGKQQVKIVEDEHRISVSISPAPEILAQTANIPHSVMKHMQQAMEYVARNCDLLLKCYDNDGAEYDVSDFLDDLRSRGDFK